MRIEELERRLRAGELVILDEVDWREIAPELEVVARHETFVAGDLVVVRTAAGLAAAERPEEGRRVIRPLGDAGRAEAFIRGRLEAYERMWDGCGCRVDSYDPAG
jgi:hypothetical protein